MLKKFVTCLADEEVDESSACHITKEILKDLNIKLGSAVKILALLQDLTPINPRENFDYVVEELDVPIASSSRAIQQLFDPVSVNLIFDFFFFFTVA